MLNDAQSVLLERDVAHLIHPLHLAAGHTSAKVWSGGEGEFLIDANGDRYIDGLSGLWNVTAGNGRHELADAAHKQMLDLAYASGYTGSSNPRAIELAERLATMTYPNINHFFFTSGGGESTDSNIKLARHYWKLMGKPNKTKVISLLYGYHGTTLAAMSTTGMGVYWPMFEPRVPGFIHIPSHYPYFHGRHQPGHRGGQRVGKGDPGRGPRQRRHVHRRAGPGCRRCHCSAGRLLPAHP